MLEEKGWGHCSASRITGVWARTAESYSYYTARKNTFPHIIMKCTACGEKRAYTARKRNMWEQLYYGVSSLSLSVSISLIQNNWWNKHWIPYAPSQSVLLLYLCVGFTIVLWMGVRAFVMCEDGTRFHCLELCCCYLMFLSRNGPTSPWISKMNQPGFICTCALATIPKCAPKWNSQVHGDRINYIGIPHIIFFSSTRVFLLQFYQILYILTSYSNIIRVVITIYSCQQSWATSTIDLLFIPLMIVNLTGNLKLILTHSNVRLNQ